MRMVRTNVIVKGLVPTTKLQVRLVAAMKKGGEWKPNMSALAREMEVSITTVWDAWKRLTRDADVEVYVVVSPRKETP